MLFSVEGVTGLTFFTRLAEPEAESGAGFGVGSGLTFFTRLAEPEAESGAGSGVGSGASS